MSIRIVVADQGEARFYDTEGAAAPLLLVGHLTNPNARLHDRDFKSDRPGRVFDHAPLMSGRRGAVAHHSTGGERRPRKREAALFAQQIAGELEGARQAKKFARLVVIAGAPFLGELRAALPRALRKAVVAEVARDLVHAPEQDLRAHLTGLPLNSPGSRNQGAF
jgi:protein required for attachment to host cells